MKKQSKPYYLLMLLFLVFPSMMKGQGTDSFPKAEKLALFTDRGLYVTGEKVHFTAFITNRPLPELSHILYVELIEPDGTKITGGKFPLSDNSASGCLEIPTGSITGVYYLRTYTKYMRNLGPNSFAYVRLKIVNPYKMDVLGSTSPTAGAVKFQNQAFSGDGLTISTDQQIYKTREKVKVVVNTAGMPQGKIRQLSVSVIPETSDPGPVPDLYSKSRQVDLVHFYPENRSLSITGTVIDSVTDKPEAGVRVNLSILGKGRTYMGILSDSTGHFYFSLPAYTGNRDLFISPEDIAGKYPRILVNNDFSAAPVHLPDPAFSMDSAERKTVLQMAQNDLVKQYYRNDSLPCAGKETKKSTEVYGKPSYVLNLDQYVQLPTLEDYIHNLSSVIKLMVRTHNGKKIIRVIGDQPEMAFLKPLLMVDGVAVDAPEKILAAPPRNIARIEVVNVPYVIGDMKFGGIVNIISKRGDFAGIDLPGAGMFLNYGFLHDTCHCAIRTPEAPEQPDARNTLFWDPDIRGISGKEIHFSFSTADTPGKYDIVIQGIDDEGNSFLKKQPIVVAPRR